MFRSASATVKAVALLFCGSTMERIGIEPMTFGLQTAFAVHAGAHR